MKIAGEESNDVAAADDVKEIQEHSRHRLTKWSPILDILAADLKVMMVGAGLGYDESAERNAGQISTWCNPPLRGDTKSSIPDPQCNLGPPALRERGMALLLSQEALHVQMQLHWERINKVSCPDVVQYQIVLWS